MITGSFGQEPFSSTDNMYLTHNGEIISITLNIELNKVITLRIDK